MGLFPGRQTQKKWQTPIWACSFFLSNHLLKYYPFWHKEEWVKRPGVLFEKKSLHKNMRSENLGPPPKNVHYSFKFCIIKVILAQCKYPTNKGTNNKIKLPHGTTTPPKNHWHFDSHAFFIPDIYIHMHTYKSLIFNTHTSHIPTQELILNYVFVWFFQEHLLTIFYYYIF